jgi:predicted MPP superfamily phosphohydrolase
VLAVLVLLFAVACLGHLVWMVALHNFWYGLPLPRHTGTPIHLVHGLFILAGWVLLWWVCGLDLLTLFQWPPLVWWQPCLAAYVVLCWFAAVVLLPVITITRLRRRLPAAVVEHQSRVLDVVKELGYEPIGRGKRSYLTRLPGNEVFRVEMIERTISLPRMPAAWDGLKILHLTDLHMGGTPDRHFYQLVMERCAAWEPDVVALTGDIVDSVHHQGWIMPALSWLRWNVAAFAILGNHDFWFDPAEVRRRLEERGFRVLANGWQQLEVRGEPMVVIGNEYPWLLPSPDLTSCPTGPFRFCLSHTPDNIRWARRAGVDLMLSGHVHGGQIRFPVVGSVLVPSLYGRHYDCGTFDEKPTLLHVSRGLSGDYPVRYGCLPEVTLLRFRAMPATLAPPR